MSRKTNTPLPSYSNLQTDPGYTVNGGLTDYNRDNKNRKLNGLYGLTAALPLTLSKEGGLSLITRLKELVKQNFKILILTEPGERIMDINFGVGLRRYLFENNTEELKEEITSRIYSQVARYMSYLGIDDVEFIEEERNPNYLKVSIYYNISELSIEDVLNISLEE